MYLFMESDNNEHVNKSTVESRAHAVGAAFATGQ
jgi:hypothetical protein